MNAPLIGRSQPVGRYGIIIIGAGISGLSLAHYCAKQGLEPLVIEKSERAGGTFQSHFFSGAASDFWLEMGAHTCYNSYGNLIDVMRDCHILDAIVKRKKVGYKMLVKGGLRSIPSQMRFAELFFSAPRLFFQKKTDQSIRSYYSSIVGGNNFRNVLGPMFDAVICQKADDFPADLLFKRRPRRKEILKNFTLNHGIQSITDAISSQPGISVVKGKEIRTVTVSDDIFSVATGDGSEYSSRNLALATDANTAARLLKSSFPEISERLSTIQVNVVESMGVALEEKTSSLPLLAGLIAVNDSFYSVVSRDTVRHDNFRGFCFHFKGGMLNREAKLKRITDVLGVSHTQIAGIVTKENLVPSLLVGHEALVGKIDRLLAGKRLLLTGNYFSGLAIEDCVSRSLSEFTRLINTFPAS